MLHVSVTNAGCFFLSLRGMFNKEKIAKMKKGVIIVNNARGAIMDTQAVADACKSGHIAGKNSSFAAWSVLVQQCYQATNRPQNFLL
jgi:lactate dehydrogenase-like 2-hydroxyacid dehydrogenase